MRKSILLLFALLCSTALFAQQTQKDAAIKELMDLTGAGKLGAQFAMMLMQKLKTSHPEVPQAYWDSTEVALNADTIEALYIPVYAKHFNLEEIQKLIAFYKSPIGSKMIRETPAIMKEAGEIGALWGKRVSERIIQNLEKDSIIMDK